MCQQILDAFTAGRFHEARRQCTRNGNTVNDTVEFAVVHNHLNLLKWLHAAFHEELYNKWKKTLFKRACIVGHYEIAHWIAEIDTDAVIDWIDALEQACRRGKIEIVRWLIETTSYADYPDTVAGAFQSACRNGHLECAQLIADELEPHLDVHADEDDAFAFAVSYGHLEIAEWLLARWPDIDPHAGEEYALHDACAEGNLDSVQWLLSKFPDTDVHIDYDGPFRKACAHGWLELAQWIADRYPPKPSNARAALINMNDYLIDNKRTDMQQATAAWIEAAFPLVPLLEYIPVAPTTKLIHAACDICMLQIPSNFAVKFQCGHGMCACCAGMCFKLFALTPPTPCHLCRAPISKCTGEEFALEFIKKTANSII